MSIIILSLSDLYLAILVNLKPPLLLITAHHDAPPSCHHTHYQSRTAATLSTSGSLAIPPPRSVPKRHFIFLIRRSPTHPSGPCHPSPAHDHRRVHHQVQLGRQHPSRRHFPLPPAQFHPRRPLALSTSPNPGLPQRLLLLGSGGAGPGLGFRGGYRELGSRGGI